MKPKTIALCSSVSFYKEVLDVQKELKKLGYKVRLPGVATIMQKSGNYDVNYYKTWFKDNDYKQKTKLMKDHFKKVIESDAILVINNKKHNINGYIGGNVLMEMVLAFHYKKPIYIYYPILKTHPFLEEVYGLNSVIINGDLQKIK